MNKYDVAYFYCHTCGLMQTEEPYWLEESYANIIARSDTGLLSRNIALALRLAAVLRFHFDPRARYVDAGGGYGVLTRLMRDVGFDYYWSDPMCANLFAQGFEALDGTHLAVSAFEVMEHVYDPIGFVRRQLSAAQSRTFIFSTQLFDGQPPPVGQWAYYSVGTGQHVTFYQRRTLDRIGAELGLALYSSGYFHLLTDRKLNRALFSILASRYSALLLPVVRLGMPSRTLADSASALAATASGSSTRSGAVHPQAVTSPRTVD